LSNYFPLLKKQTFRWHILRNCCCYVKTDILLNTKTKQWLFSDWHMWAKLDALSPKFNHLVRGPLQEISSKSVHNFLSYPTDRQTDRSKNITSFFGGGNYSSSTVVAGTWKTFLDQQVLLVLTWHTNKTTCFLDPGTGSQRCSCFWSSCCYQIFNVLKLFHLATYHNKLRLQIGENVHDFCTVSDF